MDVFGDIAVVASSAAWLEKYRSHVEACLRSSIHGINHINWRPSLDVLKEDGFDISSLKQTQTSSSAPPLPERSMVFASPWLSLWKQSSGNDVSFLSPSPLGRGKWYLLRNLARGTEDRLLH